LNAKLAKLRIKKDQYAADEGSQSRALIQISVVAVLCVIGKCSRGYGITRDIRIKAEEKV
jgi:hypothetical protein